MIDKVFLLILYDKPVPVLLKCYLHFQRSAGIFEKLVLLLKCNLILFINNQALQFVKHFIFSRVFFVYNFLSPSRIIKFIIVVFRNVSQIYWSSLLDGYFLRLNILSDNSEVNKLSKLEFEFHVNDSELFYSLCMDRFNSSRM